MSDDLARFTHYVFLRKGKLTTRTFNLGAYTDPDMIVQILAQAVRERGGASDGVAVPVCFFITQHPENDIKQKATTTSPRYYLGGVRCSAEDVRNGVGDLPEGARERVAKAAAEEDVLMVVRGGNLVTCNEKNYRILQWPPASERIQ